MQTLIALLVAAVAASAIARPPGPTAAPPDPRGLRGPPLRELQLDYMLPPLVLPQYAGYDDSPVVPLPQNNNDWLNKEIYRINQMDEYDELMRPYNADLLNWFSHNIYLQKMLTSSLNNQDVGYDLDPMQQNRENMKPMRTEAREPLPIVIKPQLEAKRDSDVLTTDQDRVFSDGDEPSDKRKKFALTPMDDGYYEPVSKLYRQTPIKELQDRASSRMAMLLEPPRQTRQNPNLSKQKHLLEPDIGKLKAGLANKEYRLPVSLLPTNLRWLKVSQPETIDHDDDQESSHEEGDTSKQHHIHVLESASDPAESIYGVALIAAVGAALAMAIVGFGFGWYTLSKRAKAAADVDYPAYGVTGPTVDSSGDRKLAHSAHMYHYQHQKQQIIAMERNGLEQQRANSVSDPESEEENEEGDYTVYECPGFATTGDMEVKNPLFSEDPTPVTPGKCEVVKPQPKD
ncbi:neural proliferation differentiation control-1 protein (NPDC1) domain-containing protein [Phthorimaea operculella]|nr:neural proliferation differentiation control-1 protein (NPDC1) domain-containing protein [Phthorimaea operculella]